MSLPLSPCLCLRLCLCPSLYLISVFSLFLSLTPATPVFYFLCLSLSGSPSLTFIMVLHLTFHGSLSLTPLFFVFHSLVLCLKLFLSHCHSHFLSLFIYTCMCLCMCVGLLSAASTLCIACELCVACAMHWLCIVLCIAWVLRIDCVLCVVCCLCIVLCIAWVLWFACMPCAYCVLLKKILLVYKKMMLSIMYNFFLTISSISSIWMVKLISCANTPSRAILIMFLMMHYPNILSIMILHLDKFFTCQSLFLPTLRKSAVSVTLAFSYCRLFQWWRQLVITWSASILTPLLRWKFMSLTALPAKDSICVSYTTYEWYPEDSLAVSFSAVSGIWAIRWTGQLSILSFLLLTSMSVDWMSHLYINSVFLLW